MWCAQGAEEDRDEREQNVFSRFKLVRHRVSF